MGKKARKHTRDRPASRVADTIAEDALTYQDYCELPDDGIRYEIIGGELYNAPAPYITHQDISLNLERILDAYCRQHSHGKMIHAPADVVLSNIDVVQPDILWISAERMPIITRKNLQGAPDLVVEIVSEWTHRKDSVVKKKLYGKFGVTEYWLIDPGKRSVSVFRRWGRGLRLADTFTKPASFSSPLFPGLTIKVKEIFS